MEAQFQALTEEAKATPEGMRLMADYAWEIAMQDSPLSRRISEEALALAEERNDPRIKGLALRNLAYVQNTSANYIEAIRLFSEAMQLLERTEEKQGLADVCTSVAWTNLQLGNFNTAIEYSNRALALNQELENARGIAWGYSSFGNVYFSAGDFKQAGRYYRKAVDHFKELKYSLGLARNYEGLGQTAFQLGLPEKARKAFRLAIKHGLSAGTRLSEAASRMELVASYLETGEWRDALAEFERVLQLGRGIRNPSIEARALTGMARACGALDELETALEQVQRAIRASEGVRPLRITIDARLVRAELLEKRERYREALDLRREIEALRKEEEKQSYEERAKSLAASQEIFQLQQSAEANRVRQAEYRRILNNLLPESIAEEMLQAGRVTARFFPSASVLFADFVGFTRISRDLSPQEIVDTLDHYFSEFDAIINKYGLEKLKTIGDGYMAAAGIPNESKLHALSCVRAAREMLQVIESARRYNSVAWNIRIGVNSGPLVAGTVGRERLAYDIWGATVNIAARLESYSEPGRINISQATRDAVEGRIRTTYRGDIEAKNVGKIAMYFVV